MPRLLFSQQAGGFSQVQKDHQVYGQSIPPFRAGFEFRKTFAELIVL